MTAENMNPVVEKKVQRSGLIGGMILILVGLLALLQQFVSLAWLGDLFLPGLALVFIAAGLLRNQVGLIIPGGILAGIGAGAIVENSLRLPEAQSGAVVLMVFACGWALITLLSAVINRRDSRQGIAWWALIPAGVMGAIGGLILIGGTALKALELAGKAWPLVLIALGLYLLLRRK